MDIKETIRQLSPVPDTGEDLVTLLLSLYPPRCKRREESLEEHLMYAGKVELLEMLQQAYKLEKEHEQERAKLKTNNPEFYERWPAARVVVSTEDVE